MNQQIEISGHRVDVELTHAAEKALAKMDRRVFAEMELYFSCLIRKKVRFYNALDDKDIVYVNDKLAVSFRPVMTQFCGKDYEGDEHLCDQYRQDESLVEIVSNQHATC